MDAMIALGAQTEEEDANTNDGFDHEAVRMLPFIRRQIDMVGADIIEHSCRRPSVSAQGEDN